MNAASVPFHFNPQVSAARRFYLELAPGAHKGAHQGVSVIGAGWEHCRGDYDVSRPGFPYVTLEFIARGEGDLEIGGRHYALRPGSVLVYGPGIPHHITARGIAEKEGDGAKESALTKYFVAAVGEELPGLLEECHLLPGTVQQVSQPGQVEAVFDDLIAQGLSDHGNRERMCAIALQYLMMKLAGLALPHSVGEAEMQVVATYQRCRQFIEQEFRTVRSLAEVAERCHVDAAYLCRLFKRFRRQTPFQYLQHLQMNDAVEMLQNRRCTVKEVAEELGFSDPYNFSRTFKRIFGVSPAKLLGGRAVAPGRNKGV